MTEISAKLVKELRDMTGAGMMECKRALVETGGNVEEAQRLLREKGMASAGKRAGRETTEGKVLADVEDSRGAMVAVGCETEPVSKNEDFLRYARRVLEVVSEQGPDAVAELEEERLALIARIGENIAVRGAARMQSVNGEVLEAYVHRPAEKIGVLLRLAGGDRDLARMLAQHISFANPQYASRDEVPDDAIAGERAIYEKLPDVVTKPEQVRPKIVEGMLGKRFFAEVVLADQPWIHETSMTVGKALEERGAEVREFVRFALAA
ncbi:MAG TPA: translation elongation factor Ts [Gaiellaceae bacterium]|nr:translation elongation factor Ts [Gaiellaceae bacterium]